MSSSSESDDVISLLVDVGVENLFLNSSICAPTSVVNRLLFSIPCLVKGDKSVMFSRLLSRDKATYHEAGAQKLLPSMATDFRVSACVL